MTTRFCGFAAIEETYVACGGLPPLFGSRVKARESDN